MQRFEDVGIPAKRGRFGSSCFRWWVLAFGLMAPFIVASAHASPKVVVTIKPVHALAAQVMDGLSEPVLLVGGASSPHTFSLRPSDARALRDARLFIRVSESVEPFTARLIGALPQSVHVVTLAEAPGLRLLPKRRSATFESHRGAADGHAHAHDHGGDWDGHVWLDPENAKAMVRAIAAAVIAVSPEDAPRINANAETAIRRLDALETELTRVLAPIMDRSFVVFHDSLQYFEHRFGLSAAAAISVSPEARPSVRRLRSVRSEVLSLDAVCVFKEPAFSDKVVDAVIEGTNAKVGTLDPEGLTVAPGPDAYDVLLRNIAKSLSDCLQPRDG